MMRNLTDFRNTVETSVDPRRLLFCRSGLLKRPCCIAVYLKVLGVNTWFLCKLPSPDDRLYSGCSGVE